MTAINRVRSTFLYYSARLEYKKAIKVLLDGGVNPSTVNKDNYTARNLTEKGDCINALNVLDGKKLIEINIFNNKLKKP